MNMNFCNFFSILALTGIPSNNKIMKEIFEFVCNNEEINSVSMDVPENKQIQSAIIKAIGGSRRTTFNLNPALYIRLVAKNKDTLKFLEKYWN